MRSICMTAGVAMLLSLAGCGTLFLPWAEVTVVRVDPAAMERGEQHPLGRFFWETVYGYQLWSGVASAAVFLGVLLLLVITGPLQPIPAWRSVALLAGAAAAVGIIVGGMAVPPPAFRSDEAAGRLVAGVSWGLGHYLALGMASGVLLMSAWELRRWVARRVPGRRQAEEPSKAESGATADRPPI